MWKRDEAPKPASPATPEKSGAPAPQPVAPTAPVVEARRPVEKDVVNIGKSVVIKGELNGSEDLTVEGQVEIGRAHV